MWPPCDLPAAAARRAPDRLALVAGEVRWSFAELARRVEAMASAIARIAGPGERVAVLAANSADHVVALSAVPRAGAVLCMLNWRLHPREWADQLARAGAVAVIGDAGLLARLEPELGAAPPVTEVLTWSDPALAKPGPLPALAPDPDAPCWLIFTSGTTGAPKGAVITHRSLATAITGAAICRPVALDEVYLFPFPLCHVAAYNVIVHLAHARPVVLAERFDADAALASVAAEGVTSISLAPTMLSTLVGALEGGARARSGAQQVASLRSVGYGASAVAPDLLRRAARVIGCDLNQGYGMTELSGNAVFLDAALHRRGLAGEEHLLASAGRPSPLVSVAILDDRGAELPTGEVGEIGVAGDQVCAGYWDDPAADAATRTADGWFRTGDVGRIDAEGLVAVVDRRKDLIVTGGENVASREVEGVLADHPAVGEVAVVGTPDETWGERVCAVVVPAEPGGLPEEVDLEALVRHRLAGFKVPRYYRFVDALPRNASGKVLKAELRDALVDEAGLADESRADGGAVPGVELGGDVGGGAGSR